MKLESNGYILTVNDEEAVYLKQTHNFLFDLYRELKDVGLQFKDYEIADLARVTDLLYELLYEDGVCIE